MLFFININLRIASINSNHKYKELYYTYHYPILKITSTRSSKELMPDLNLNFRIVKLQ